MAQAVSGWPVTAMARVRSQASPGTKFMVNYRFPLSLQPHQHSALIVLSKRETTEYG